MMACIYTNTQTCTYTVHTVYLYTYCTHAHICIYICASIRYGSDPTTVTNWWDLEAKWTLAGLNTVWFIISMVHWESWWYCENVALFPFFYFSRYVLFLLLFLKPLYCIVVCNVTNILLCISRFFKLHTTPQSSLCFVLFFCEVMPFIKAIDLLQCLNDPDLTHTPRKLYRLKINAQTIRGREKGG